MKHKILLLGAGKIGEAILALFSKQKEYEVAVFDTNINRAKQIAKRWGCSAIDDFDISGKTPSDSTVKVAGKYNAIISALPFHCNIKVAKVCVAAKTHYFDLTEDVDTKNAIKQLSKNLKGVYFAPQCGLAPGFIGIVAHSIVSEFDTVKSLKMRVGALPINPTNRLKYNLTWSTEGLINEYCNPCDVLYEGKRVKVMPLEGYETLTLEGEEYEAFHTSGGVGSLVDLLEGKVESLDYKTLRYPGHRELIAFLLHDLGFKENRTLLKEIFEKNIPRTLQDKCIVFVEAVGIKAGELLQKSYLNVIKSCEINNQLFGAIQISTASGICGVVDLALKGKIKKPDGFVGNEDIDLKEFLKSKLTWSAELSS